jgi:hypothetical protein
MDKKISDLFQNGLRHSTPCKVHRAKQRGRKRFGRSATSKRSLSTRRLREWWGSSSSLGFIAS